MTVRLAQRMLTALAAGLCLWLSLPPRGWWPLAVAGAFLLVFAVRRQPARLRMLAGCLAGLGLFVPALWWLTGFFAPGYVLVVALEALVWGAAVALSPPKRGIVFGLPSALILAEAVRLHWPLGGLPLASPALGQVDGPWAATAGIAGGLALVGLPALTGAALAELCFALQARNVRGPVGLASALGALALSVGAAVLAPLAVAGDAAGAVRVAVIQGGGPRGIPAVHSDESAVFERHLQASAQVVPGSVDLVVWPEDVVDVDGPIGRTPEGAELARLARRLGATVVAGVVEDVAGQAFRNAAVAWGPNGRIVARYEKVHRVPFGEYIPARAFVARFADVSLVPRDAIAGHGPGLLESPAGRLGAVISFEVFFPDRARAAINAGGGVLLVPTNAASYTDPVVPAEEVAAARLRALETSRYVIQAAPTGYSAIVDNTGDVLARSALEQPAVLRSTVDVRRSTTPYARIGELPLVALAVATLFTYGVSFRLKSKLRVCGRRPDWDESKQAHSNRQSSP